MSVEQEKADYWREFYRNASIPVVPSQFAVFAIAELAAADVIVDIGCGSGRDSLFFARQGLRVIGVDGSQSAVETCSTRATDTGLDNASFVCADVGSADFGKTLASQIAEASPDKAPTPAGYARFFIHALTEEEEHGFLAGTYEALAPTKGLLALEFRTHRDREQVKVTPDHFRRFVDAFSFINRAQAIGYTLEYFVEGFGFAKHKTDDAHVARCILRASN